MPRKFRFGPFRTMILVAIAAILVLIFITVVPDSVLWLPRLMGYKG